MSAKQIAAAVVAGLAALAALGAFLGLNLRPAWVWELDKETVERVELEVDYRSSETRDIKRDIYEIEQQQQAIDPSSELQRAYSDQLILLNEDLEASQEKLDAAKSRLESVIKGD